MSGSLLSRRDIFTFATASALAALASNRSADGAAKLPVQAEAMPRPFGRFITDYMRNMNAPGLMLGVAGTRGAIASGCYGYVDLAARLPVMPAHLFQIGSITKSFVALVILQLQDEGWLDIQHPILRYLPWLPVETPYGEILIHHLLTHSSGMPEDAPVYPGQTGARIRQAFEPGTRFHYSNWGFNILGPLIEKIDNCAWPEALTRRLLTPLGMGATAAAITSSTRARIAQSYLPLHEDRPYPRRGALVPSGNLTFTDPSGSIASTAHDMTCYMQMLLNRGAGPSGRVVSEDGFRLFTTGHIEAPPFGPGARYGYGIAIDQLDGHTRLRHTGGMASFMSAMQLDMDAGLGAFASINAYQDYRPNAVAQYALQLLRARAEGRKIAVPVAEESVALTHAGDYTGTYSSPGGGQLEVILKGDRLELRAHGASTPLQHRADDEFVADHEQFALFPLVFRRESAPATRSPTDARPEVIELAYGPDSYTHARHRNMPPIPPTPQLAPYQGLYHSDEDPTAAARIVERQGRLWLDGSTPLVPIGGQLFRVGDEPASPETAEFTQIFDGRARVLILRSEALRRIGDATDA